MPDAGAAVRIHYHRPPARTDLFVQQLVAADAECIITLMRHTPLARPLVVAGETILEDGAPVLWFTWPGRMHDVGCFHDAQGEPTGWYANLLTPVRFRSPLEWETTDLFLDVWVPRQGPPTLLDEDEFAAAVAAGWLEPALAAAAVAEAERLREAAAAGRFPDATVREWTLARARGTLERRAG